ncbi:MAG: hypothetical protein JSV23_05270 [Promethearchaeota archaeon]|nr:MAG: hypothetical protein JSV23_05270 [Candidatus Lokiarchaeota archaeon]
MSDFEWSKVDFHQFINEYGKEIIVENAPTILYSKKDKEHEAYNSLIAFFFIAGFLLIYIAISYFLASIFFNPILFTVIIIVCVIIDVLLIINVIKSNVYIKPLECWVEVHQGRSENTSDFYCFTYYPIFTGKCHPNEAINVIFKLYQEQVLKSKIDITQIEIYLKLSQKDNQIKEKLGFFFQYAEGKSFKDENINRKSWKYFHTEQLGIENYMAVGNWDHQYEWRNDLEFDFDKLHEYAPWVIQRWNDTNIKFLTEDYKERINWNSRYIESTPKLRSWEGNLESQSYENPMAYRDIDIVNEAIEKIIGYDKKIEKTKNIKDELPLFKSYFRDLGS